MRASDSFDHVLQRHGCKELPCGLEVPGDISLAAASIVAEALRKRIDKSQWSLGDLWNAIKRRHGEGATVAQALGRNYQTCMNCGRVADVFPEFSRRREKLHFGHFEAIAGKAKTREEREHWLNRTEQHEWSVDQLRFQLRNWSSMQPKPTSGPVATLPSAQNGGNARFEGKTAPAEPLRVVSITAPAIAQGRTAAVVEMAEAITPVRRFISLTMVAHAAGAEALRGPPATKREATEAVSRAQSLLATAEQILRKVEDAAADGPARPITSDRTRSFTPKARRDSTCTVTAIRSAAPP